jgi:hypothetical protein
MSTADSRDIEIALKLLEATRERQRRCYEKHKEERKAKRREYYYKKKDEAEALKKQEDEVKFKEAVQQAIQEKLGEVVV